MVDKEGIEDSVTKAGEPFEIVSVDHTTTASPENNADADDEGDIRMSNYASFLRRPAMSEKTNQRDELHPYTATLSVSDIDDCVQLEDAVFPENERCSREKVWHAFTSLLSSCDCAPEKWHSLRHRSVLSRCGHGSRDRNPLVNC